jgi:hypothetical protein
MIDFLCSQAASCIPDVTELGHTGSDGASGDRVYQTLS